MNSIVYSAYNIGAQTQKINYWTLISLLQEGITVGG